MLGSPYVNIARVVKTRGLEGKVTVQFADGLPFCVFEGLSLSVVPPNLEGVRFTEITSVESLDDAGCILALRGVDTIDAAEELVGRCLLAAKADLDLDPDESHILLVGMPVVSDDGTSLGQVSELIETAANDVLVVVDGSKEILIPVIDECIVSVPEQEGQPLVVHLLEGLR